METHAPEQTVTTDVQPTETPIQEVASRTSDELDEYDRNRPFSAAHYSAKDIRQRQLSLKTDELLRKQVAKESLKQTIELLFWRVSANLS